MAPAGRILATPTAFTSALYLRSNSSLSASPTAVPNNNSSTSVFGNNAILIAIVVVLSAVVIGAGIVVIIRSPNPFDKEPEPMPIRKSPSVPELAGDAIDKTAGRDELDDDAAIHEAAGEGLPHEMDDMNVRAELDGDEIAVEKCDQG